MDLNIIELTGKVPGQVKALVKEAMAEVQAEQIAKETARWQDMQAVAASNPLMEAAKAEMKELQAALDLQAERRKDLFFEAARVASDLLKVLAEEERLRGLMAKLVPDIYGPIVVR